MATATQSKDLCGTIAIQMLQGIPAGTCVPFDQTGTPWRGISAVS